MSGSAVTLRNIVKEYPGVRALDALDLELAPGEFVALLGPSGCGKTTALRALAGLETITSGEIRIDGDDVTDVPTNRRDLGMVFQAYSLFPHMTVAENVEYGLRMRRVAKPERRERAEESIALVGLAGREGRFAHQLSGGQQQRVALARALVTRPKVLLLDEPLSALDAKVRVQLREEVRRIQTELGITTLFVTHDQEEALAVADRVAVMNAGRIEQIGTPEELYATPSTAFVADFVGISNRVRGELTGSTIVAHGTRFPLLGEPLPEGPVTAYVRPEDIRFAASSGDGAGAGAGVGMGVGVEAVVLTSSFLGSLRRTRVRLADGTLLSVQHAVEDVRRPGEDVRVVFSGRPVAAAAAAAG